MDLERRYVDRLRAHVMRVQYRPKSADLPFHLVRLGYTDAADVAEAGGDIAYRKSFQCLSAWDLGLIEELVKPWDPRVVRLRTKAEQAFMIKESEIDWGMGGMRR